MKAPLHPVHALLPAFRTLLPLLSSLFPFLLPRPLPADSLDKEHRLTSSLATPHVPWGRGWAKGRVRALFFLGRPRFEGESTPGTAIRDVIELLQRFDFDADAVLMHNDGIFRSDPQQFPKQEGVKRLERLLQQEWHVYVFCNARIDKLPPDSLRLIRERIEQGAGAVHFGPKPPDLFAADRKSPPPDALFDKIPLSVLDPAPEPAAPPKAGKDARRNPTRLRIDAFSLGQGRGLTVDFGGDPLAVTPLREYSPRAVVEYEYWTALAGLAILHAAGRAPDAAVSLASPDPPRIDRADLARAPLRLAIAAGNEAPPPFTLSCTLRRLDGRTHDLGTRAVPDARKPVEIRLPEVSAGTYVLDVLLDGPRGRESFAAFPIEITSRHGVASIALDRNFFEPGEPVAGRVTLRGGPFSTRDRIRIRLHDAHDRVTAQTDLRLNSRDTTFPFSLPPPPDPTIGMRAEAALLIGNDEIGAASAPFTVPDRRHGRFNFVMWGGLGDVAGFHGMRKIRETGFTVALHPGPPSAASAACDMAHAPYTTHINGDPGSGVCWNAEPDIDDFVRGIVDGTGKRAWAKPTASRAHGAFVYSLGDEVAVSGCCSHPACLRAFRDYLRAEYSSLDALNAAWKTDFASFDDVRPLSGDDALKEKLYPRWLDRAAFARRNFAGLCRRFREACRKLDPQAITGFEGAGSYGDDAEGFIRENGFWVPYPGRGVDDLIRSLAPRAFVRSNWNGYQPDAKSLVAGAWRSITLGADSVWWFETNSWLAPTLDLRPAAAAVAEEMKVVREGLGDLLVRSEMPFDGVAVLYSLPSALSCDIPESDSTLGDRTEMNNPGRPHWSVCDLTKDLGYQFRYVTSRQVEAGGLDGWGCRVLWLPVAQALGPREAAAIRKFVESGGWVIADLRPGIYDAHGVPQTPGLLDDMFGARREGRGPGRAAALDLRVTFEGREIRLENKSTQVDPHLREAGAKALARDGETPLLLVNRFGRGASLLLNFELNLYSEIRHEPASDGMREMVGAAYAAAGLRPVVPKSAPDGGPVRGIETAHWRNGDALIFSLFRNPGLWHSLGPLWMGPKDPVNLRCALSPQGGAAPHVYDLRARKPLGALTALDLPMNPGDARFFAVLPRPVGAVSLTVTPERIPQGAAARASMRVENPSGAHAVFVEGFTPSGAPAPWLTRVVIAEGGKADFDVPAAWNDPPGEWRMRATELYSGGTAEARYRVKEKE